MSDSNTELLDLIIIGGGAAGPAASIYASRRRLNFKILTKDIGGEVALCGEVENWPGIIHTTGIELSAQFGAHMKSYEPHIEEGIEVTGIRQEGNIHIVEGQTWGGDKKEWRTKTVIIATGIHPRMLGIPGEEEYRGKGVTYCTVCDGPLFRNKTTATVGAGNAALESALMMSGIASKVYLLTKYADTPENRGGFPRGEQVLIEKVKATPNIEIIYSADTKEIKGAGLVSHLTYTGTITGETKDLEVNGVMVHIGVIPNSTFVPQLEQDASKQIVVSLTGSTNIPGIFAAGDVTSIPYNQIIIAAGQGATAALSAIEYVNKWQA